MLRLFLMIFAFYNLQASVCLNMIVKNEREVIEKCLASVKPLIDYWVIVDTGSTDGTQDVIKQFMKGVPGELHERAWVNFEHNRNESLALAKNKADYLLFIDADEVFEYAPNFSLPSLTHDYYQIMVRQIGAAEFPRISLAKAKLPWKWAGVLHEALECPIATNSSLLPGIINLCNTNSPSGRSKDPNKYLNDAAILEDALKKEPNNSRYVYYLAQSYAASNQYELALKNYEKRATMSSSDIQETFFAIYSAGKINEKLGNYEEALKNFFAAYNARPTRAEPLLMAAVVYRKLGNPFLGYLIAKYALTIPRPMDNCVEYAPYDYAILIEFANCALLTNRWQEGLEASQKLLTNPNLPQEYKSSVIANCELAKNHLDLQKVN